MKLSCCKIKTQIGLLSECINIAYAAYYSISRWNLSRRVLTVFYGFYKCLEVIIFLPFLKKMPGLKLKDQEFNFICTRHYVDQDFVNFLNDMDDELTSLISVQRLDDNIEVNAGSLKFQQSIWIILSILGTWLNLLVSSVKGNDKFYKSYLVLKHFRVDLLPELVREQHCNLADGNLNSSVILFADEGSPRIQAFLRLSGVSENKCLRRVHIQHGVVSENTLEWNYSIADTFFVISQKTKKYLDELFGGSKTIFLTGPYVRKRPDAAASDDMLCDGNNGLILLQPYVKQFGKTEEFLHLWEKVAAFCRVHSQKRWIVRMHPVQNFTQQLKEIFSIQNCKIDNTAKLESQINGSDFVIGISSQTSYEVISCGKPLLLIRHSNMNIAENFEHDFSLHLCDVNLLFNNHITIDYEAEMAKSQITRSRQDLGIAPFTYEEVRNNFLICLKKVKQKNET